MELELQSFYVLIEDLEYIMERMKIQLYSWQVHRPDVQCSGHLYHINYRMLIYKMGKPVVFRKTSPSPFFPDVLLAQAHGSHSQTLL